MTQQAKKWVFTELVKDPNNIEQLLAYAVYKSFKDELARTAREAGAAENEIELKLSAYHDQCLTSSRQLQVFRTSAQQTLDGYVAVVNQQLQDGLEAAFAKQEAKYQKKIKSLEKEIEETERKALKKLVEGADKYSKQIKKPVGFWEHLAVYGLAIIKFLFSGVPKLFATAFSIGFLFIIWGMSNGDAIMGLRQGLYKMVDITVPGGKVDHTPNEASSITPSNKDLANKQPNDKGM
ncbi:TPA: hypothetical protein QHK07_004575 [Klebsiella aerogenes]|nr:hypothetical protein [Klebsiella aerogenes]